MKQGEQSDKGTYQPYQSQSGNRDDAVSTDGVSESALDFLMQRQAGGTPGQEQAQPPAQPGQPSSQQSSQSQDSVQQDAQPQQEQVAQQDQAQQQDSESESREQTTEPDMRGIITSSNIMSGLKVSATSIIRTGSPRVATENPFSLSIAPICSLNGSSSSTTNTR